MKSMDKLVDDMISSNMLKSPLIIDAFRTIDRKYFVPEEYAEDTYIDAPLPIGNYQTISQPSTVAFMLERLAPQDGNKYWTSVQVQDGLQHFFVILWEIKVVLPELKE